MPTPATEVPQSGELPAFGAWMARQRKRLGWSQPKLAQHLHCSLSLIRHFEAGTRRPNKDMAESLVQLFAVPQDQQAAYVAWAQGDPPPAREIGPAVFVQETVAAVEQALDATLAAHNTAETTRLRTTVTEAMDAALAAHTAEEPAWFAAAVTQAVEAVLAAHGVADAATLAAAVVAAMHAAPPRAAPAVGSAQLRMIVKEALAEYAATQAAQTAQLRQQFAEAMAPALVLAQEQMEQRHAARAWQEGVVGWYRVHVKQQVAAAALMGLLLHGFPAPVADGLVWTLGGVLVWASAGVWRYWRPVENWWDHWDAARDVVMQALGRTLALPALTLLVVMTVLR